MAVLVTRPHPDNELTAASLRARGFEVLSAPMLRFEPMGLRNETGGGYDGVIITSANALRAVEADLPDSRLLKLPLFAIGPHSAGAARAAGFTTVISADGDVGTLRDRLLDTVRAGALKKKSRLLYLAGADLSRDLAGELAPRGFDVVTRTTYRMMPLNILPREVCDAFTANRVEAVLHFSRRTAVAFLDAVRRKGIEISALAVPQCCISGNVAQCLYDAGATRVLVAASPDENALFGTLDRALRSRLA